MSWWEKITRRGRKTPETVARFPFRFELSDELRAKVFVHEVCSQDGLIPCWTYVSDGLWARGQKELVFTLRRRTTEKENEIPLPPLQFFIDVNQFARQGQLVDAGDFTEFGPTGFLNRSDLRGLAYINPSPLEGVELPSAPSLAVIGLYGEEMDAAKLYGVTRVAAFLGMAYRYYPCPPWLDLDRASLVSLAALEKSVLKMFTRATIPGATAHRVGQDIILRLGPRARPWLQNLRDIPRDVSIAFFTQVDFRANACLVWNPPKHGVGPAAISPPGSDGSCLAGCFIAFVPGQAEDGGQLVEDGFAVHLTDTSWGRIREALSAETSVFVPATAGKHELNFSLKWIEQAYENPVDGITYYSEEGWDLYFPQSGLRAKSLGIVSRQEIILLSAQADIERHLGLKSFCAFVEVIDHAIESYFSGSMFIAGQELLVQIELHPGSEVEVKLLMRPQSNESLQQALHQRLLALSVPAVKGPIKFQLAYRVAGGSGTPLTTS
ncbi:MAG: hypothetical protein ACE5MH_04435 [Terriglobia bacterium]